MVPLGRVSEMIGIAAWTLLYIPLFSCACIDPGILPRGTTSLGLQSALLSISPRFAEDQSPFKLQVSNLLYDLKWCGTKSISLSNLFEYHFFSQALVKFSDHQDVPTAASAIIVLSALITIVTSYFAPNPNSFFQVRGMVPKR